MFQTSGDKDKDKKTKKKGRFTSNVVLILTHREVSDRFRCVFQERQKRVMIPSQRKKKNQRRRKAKGRRKRYLKSHNSHINSKDLKWNVTQATFNFSVRDYTFLGLIKMTFWLKERSPSPEIEFDDLEKFVMEPAPQGVTIKCRVTRDQRGMDKSLYPLYYLHLDNEKKVTCHCVNEESSCVSRQPKTSTVLKQEIETLSVAPLIKWVHLVLCVYISSLSCLKFNSLSSFFCRRSCWPAGSGRKARLQITSSPLTPPIYREVERILLESWGESHSFIHLLKSSIQNVFSYSESFIFKYVV